MTHIKEGELGNNSSASKFVKIYFKIVYLNMLIIIIYFYILKYV